MGRGRTVNVSAQEIADGWNATNPVGTKVWYWTGTREGEGRLSATRTEARVLGGHTPIIWVEDIAGCLALTHVRVVMDATEATNG